MIELTELDGNVIEVFETREAAADYIRAHHGEPTFGEARAHYPEGTAEDVRTARGWFGYLVTVEGEE